MVELSDREMTLTISEPELLPTVTAAAKKFARLCSAELITAAARAVEVAP